MAQFMKIVFKTDISSGASGLKWGLEFGTKSMLSY